MHAKSEISNLRISLTEIADTNAKLKLMDSTKNCADLVDGSALNKKI